MEMYIFLPACYLLPEKNLNQDRVPFSKEETQFNCHYMESGNYCLKCYTVCYTGVQTRYAQVFLDLYTYEVWGKK